MIARARCGCGRLADRWTRMVGRWLSLTAALLLTLAPLAGLAHGGGLELSLSPTNVAAGNHVTVAGEGFPAHAQLELHLTGPNGDAHFGAAKTDGEGDFTERVQIPGDVTPGLYLIGTSGAQEASAELTVGAMPGMGQEVQAAAPERQRSGAWRAIVVVLLLGIGALGFVLTRPSRRVRPQPAA